MLIFIKFHWFIDSIEGVIDSLSGLETTTLTQSNSTSIYYLYGLRQNMSSLRVYFLISKMRILLSWDTPVSQECCENQIK